jgi:hypothetical protein
MVARNPALAPGFTPRVLPTIHTSADTADTLSADGMTLIYNAIVGLLLEPDTR